MATCISLEGGLVRLTEGQPAGTRGVPADIAHANPSTLGVPHMAVAAATVSQLGQGCDDRTGAALACFCNSCQPDPVCYTAECKCSLLWAALPVQLQSQGFAGCRTARGRTAAQSCMPVLAASAASQQSSVLP